MAASERNSEVEANRLLLFYNNRERIASGIRVCDRNDFKWLTVIGQDSFKIKTVIGHNFFFQTVITVMNLALKNDSVRITIIWSKFQN